MNHIDNFDIKYWGDSFTYDFPRKKKRTIKKKLFIVVGFLTILGITPALFFGLSNFKLNQPKKISITQTQAPKSEAQISPTQTPDKNATIQRGDSYWRISKRVCGSGKYYLLIQELNGGKPLHQGDLVKISCNL